MKLFTDSSHFWRRVFKSNFEMRSIIFTLTFKANDWGKMSDQIKVLRNTVTY